MDEDSRTATFDRKRHHDIVVLDEISNASSAKSTPRKRARRYGNIRHQDSHSLVSNSAGFSKSAAHVGEDQGSEDDGLSEISEGERDGNPSSTAYVVHDEGGDDLALNEGRRLHIGNLPGLATEADIRELFGGYSMCVLQRPSMASSMRLTSRYVQRRDYHPRRRSIRE